MFEGPWLKRCFPTSPYLHFVAVFRTRMLWIDLSRRVMLGVGVIAHTLARSRPGVLSHLARSFSPGLCVLAPPLLTCLHLREMLNHAGSERELREFLKATSRAKVTNHSDDLPYKTLNFILCTLRRACLKTYGTSLDGY